MHVKSHECFFKINVFTYLIKIVSMRIYEQCLYRHLYVFLNMTIIKLFFKKNPISYFNIYIYYFLNENEHDINILHTILLILRIVKKLLLVTNLVILIILARLFTLYYPHYFSVLLPTSETYTMHNIMIKIFNERNQNNIFNRIIIKA